MTNPLITALRVAHKDPQSYYNLPCDDIIHIVESHLTLKLNRSGNYIAAQTKYILHSTHWSINQKLVIIEKLFAIGHGYVGYTNALAICRALGKFGHKILITRFLDKHPYMSPDHYKMILYGAAIKSNDDVFGLIESHLSSYTTIIIILLGTIYGGVPACFSRRLDRYFNRLHAVLPSEKFDNFELYPAVSKHTPSTMITMIRSTVKLKLDYIMLTQSIAYDNVTCFKQIANSRYLTIQMDDVWKQIIKYNASKILANQVSEITDKRQNVQPLCAAIAHHITTNNVTQLSLIFNNLSIKLHCRQWLLLAIQSKLLSNVIIVHDYCLRMRYQYYDHLDRFIFPAIDNFNLDVFSYLMVTILNFMPPSVNPLGVAFVFNDTLNDVLIKLASLVPTKDNARICDYVVDKLWNLRDQETQVMFIHLAKTNYAYNQQQLETVLKSTCNAHLTQVIFDNLRKHGNLDSLELVKFIRDTKVNQASVAAIIDELRAIVTADMLKICPY